MGSFRAVLIYSLYKISSFAYLSFLNKINCSEPSSLKMLKNFCSVLDVYKQYYEPGRFQEMMHLRLMNLFTRPRDGTSSSSPPPTSTNSLSTSNGATSSRSLSPGNLNEPVFATGDGGVAAANRRKRSSSSSASLKAAIFGGASGGGGPAGATGGARSRPREDARCQLS